jgi:hypothetical protein
VAPKTAENYEYHVRGMLGWLHNVRAAPLEQLSLRSAFPSAERLGVAVVFDYLQWLATERGANARTQQITLHGLMHAAKFAYHDESVVSARAIPAPFLWCFCPGSVACHRSRKGAVHRSVACRPARRSRAASCPPPRAVMLGAACALLGRPGLVVQRRVHSQRQRSARACLPQS